MSAEDPVMLFERATTCAATVMNAVSAEQLSDPTPCAAWDVQQLIDHMVGATASGLVGPAVEVPADASPQDRLLAAMGRQP